MNAAHRARRLAAEFVGTALLVAVIVGSGIAASRLTDDAGLALLANGLATALGLFVIIAVIAPVSGANLNPVVSLVDGVIERRRGGLRSGELALYVVAQVAGAACGALLANAMFEVPLGLSRTERAGAGTLLGEVVATAGLILVIVGLARHGERRLIAPAVAAYIGAAYWFTSSTSFANPAVTIGRTLTDTVTGIAPGSALLFIAAQVIGGALGALTAILLFPRRAGDPPAASEASG